MGHRRIVLTPAAARFLEEWRGGGEYVTAHTSGSTGAHKEIHLSKADMRASARATIDFFNLTPDSLLLLPLSPGYIAGMMQIVRAEEAGCSLVVEEASAVPFAQVDTPCAPTLVPVVPAQVEGLMESPLFASIGNLIIGGAPLSPALEERIVGTGVRAFATYGMTETCSHVALRRLGDREFRGLPGFRFSTDGRGCLVIESETLSFRRLVTTDVVRLLDDDRFEWLGRADNVINSGGVKIHPEEVERVMLPMLPEGALAYVTSRPSRRWGEEAVIVTDSPEVGEELLCHLRAVLPPRHCPKAIIHVPEIALTDSRKIIRKKIR